MNYQNKNQNSNQTQKQMETTNEGMDTKTSQNSQSTKNSR